MSINDTVSREEWIKLVRDDSITWLSSTTFATENKDLGHAVADVLLQSIVQGCEDLENDNDNAHMKMTTLPILRTQTLVRHCQN